MSLINLKESFIESPSWRTFFSFIVPLIAGVVSGIFVSEITKNGLLDWSAFYKTKSFYGLVFLIFCIYHYNKAIYLYEKQVSQFLDADYCTAYVRSKCLPEAAERYKQLIRNGGGGELKQAMDELKKVLK
jgi:hypothetical protein